MQDAAGRVDQVAKKAACLRLGLRDRAECARNDASAPSASPSQLAGADACRDAAPAGQMEEAGHAGPGPAAGNAMTAPRGSTSANARTIKALVRLRTLARGPARTAATSVAAASGSTASSAATRSRSSSSSRRASAKPARSSQRAASSGVISVSRLSMPRSPCQANPPRGRSSDPLRAMLVRHRSGCISTMPLEQPPSPQPTARGIRRRSLPGNGRAISASPCGARSARSAGRCRAPWRFRRHPSRWSYSDARVIRAAVATIAGLGQL